MFTIYALRDPRDLQFHYIGMTENHPVWRLVQHLQDKQDKNLAKLAWLADLKTLNVRPDVAALQYAPDLETALFLEQYWIKVGLQAGWPLTNQERTFRRYKTPKVSVPRVARQTVQTPTSFDLQVEEWRIAHPNGTQSELRKHLGELGIRAARSTVHKSWHRCKDKLGTDITGGA